MKSKQKVKPKRLLSLLLTLAMVLTVFPIMGTTTATAYTGSGESMSDPYMVDTYDELRQVMKTRAWMSGSSNDSSTYITLDSDILIEDSKSDYYLETFSAETHKVYLNLNGHTLSRNTNSSDKYMFDVKCHLLISDRKGGGTIRFKTTASDGDTAVFYDNTYSSWLEIFDDAYVVNDTAENSEYKNCGVLATGTYPKKIYAENCRIAAQLPLKMTGAGECFVYGASLCSTSKSSYVALDFNATEIKIYGCSAYGDILLKTNYTCSIYKALTDTTIYRNGIEKDFSSIRKNNVYEATLSSNGGVLTVTKQENPFIENVDVTDVSAPSGGTKIGDFKYTVKNENVIDVGVTIVNSKGIALTSDKLFVEGETYKYYIHVMPKGGYMFKANAITGVSTGTINGETVETVIHPSWYSSMGTDIRLISSFTVIPAVNEFSATVQEPVVGSTPSFVATPGDSKKYTATVDEWVYEMSDKYSMVMSEDSAFHYGCTYKLYVKFEINDGYEASDATYKLPGTINGKTAKNISPGNVNYGMFVITYTMPEAPAEEYDITVYSGSARNNLGYKIKRAAAGTVVTLTAKEPAEGKVFDKWSVREGTVEFEDPYSTTTTFVMPAESVQLVASFKAGPHTHIFDLEIMKSDAIKTPADCENDAVYYMSCSICREEVSDTETFTATGTAKGHKYSEEWSKDETHHWNECTVCSDKKDAEEHTPNIAEPTETQAKVCTVCDYVIADKLPAKNGTVIVDGKTVLYIDGTAVEGTKVVTAEGKTYAVVKGYVVTGKIQTVTISGKTYIVDKNGVVIKSGKNRLVKVNSSKWYVVNKYGIVIKAKSGNMLVKVGSKTYIVNKYGLVQKTTKSKLVNVGKKTYAVVKDSVLTGKTRTITISKKTYIVDKNGAVIKSTANKLVKVSKNNWYVVNKAGTVINAKKGNILVKVSKKSYIVNKKGLVLKNKKAVKVGKKTYKINKYGIATRKK